MAAIMAADEWWLGYPDRKATLTALQQPHGCAAEAQRCSRVPGAHLQQDVQRRDRVLALIAQRRGQLPPGRQHGSGGAGHARSQVAQQRARQLAAQVQLHQLAHGCSGRFEQARGRHI